MNFQDPWVLLLIPFICILVFLWARRKKSTTFLFPSLELFQGHALNWKTMLSDKMIFMRLAVLALFIISLARPQIPFEETKHQTEGIDIVLTVDVSGSMAAEDFTLNGRRINRLAVIKDVVSDFIKGRSSDRIGLVAFGGLAYTVCPLTTDHDWLEKNLERVELGSIEDGTAIGSAISSSLLRLKNSKAKSKVIILLTDGVSNAGKITPLEAAKAARAMGVKIYAIGAGSKWPVPFPVQDLWGRTVYQNVEINMDEGMLKQIAFLTNAKYFNATDTESLRHIYKEIDALEKTKIEESDYKEYKEIFSYFLLGALLLLVLEILLNNTFLLRIP